MLEDGTVFMVLLTEKRRPLRENLFNTSMTGYQNYLPIQSYFGQLLVSTNVHVGNYGIKEARNGVGTYSNYRVNLQRLYQ